MPDYFVLRFKYCIIIIIFYGLFISLYGESLC